MGEVIQSDLFGHQEKPKAKSAERLEVHEHAIISGPRAHICGRNKIVHSHEGGDEPHSHPNMGPACFTIDKDEWAAMTGLRGGGRKKFTDEPGGEQFPITQLEKWQTEFEIHIDEPPADFEGQGAGIAPAARMTLAFGMKVTSITDHRPKRRA